MAPDGPSSARPVRCSVLADLWPNHAHADVLLGIGAKSSRIGTAGGLGSLHFHSFRVWLEE